MIMPDETSTRIVLAYIDLGTGSYAAQMAIAILAGGLATAGFYWKRIRNWFKEHKIGKRNKDS